MLLSSGLRLFSSTGFHCSFIAIFQKAHSLAYKLGLDNTAALIVRQVVFGSFVLHKLGSPSHVAYRLLAHKVWETVPSDFLKGIVAEGWILHRLATQC